MPVISFYTPPPKKKKCLKPLRQSVKADVSHLIALALSQHLRRISSAARTARHSRPFSRSWRAERTRAAGADTSRGALIGPDEKFHLRGPSSAANGH